jgi:hypothetical protein
MKEPNSLPPSSLMCAAIGLFSISWSALEMALDFWVVLAFHHFDGNILADKRYRSVAILARLLERNRLVTNFPHGMIDI